MVITLQARIQSQHRRRVAATALAGSALLLLAALLSPPWRPAPYVPDYDEAVPELVTIPDEIPPLPALLPEPVRPAFLPQFTLVAEDETGDDPDALFPGVEDGLPMPPIAIHAGKFAAARETPPTPILRVDPAYPELLREAGLEGTVWLSVVVGATGDVIAVRALNPDAPAALVEAAVAAAWRWRFRPARQGVKPVRAVTTLGFTFRIR